MLNLIIPEVQVDKQGFEPRSATLKAAVLPLNHSPEQNTRHR